MKILTKQGKLDISYAVKSSGVFYKDIDPDKRTVKGIYNAYNFIDYYGDVLIMGCAAKTISERGPESNATAKIKHAIQHDLNRLPGKVMVLDEREVNGIQGIYFETKMTSSTLGNDTLINYQEEVYDNHSIGFQYKQLEYHEEGSAGFERVKATLINPEVADKLGWLWEVKEIELFEGSTVAFGANSLTPFLGVKSGDKTSVAIKIADRIERLQQDFSKGAMAEGMIKIELLQLKQMVQELDFEPHIKDTLRKEPPSTQNSKKSLIHLLNEIKI